MNIILYSHYFYLPFFDVNKKGVVVPKTGGLIIYFLEGKFIERYLTAAQLCRRGKLAMIELQKLLNKISGDEERWILEV